MSDDIVERLRVLTATLRLGDFQGLAETTNEAADEIERLRESLRIESEELAACTIDRRETQRERDEARRDVCNSEAMLRLQRNRVHRDSEEVVRMAKEIAVAREWDCFKEATDGK